MKTKSIKIKTVAFLLVAVTAFGVGAPGFRQVKAAEITNTIEDGDSLSEQDKAFLKDLKNVGIETMFELFKELVPGGKVASPALKMIVGKTFGDKETSLDKIEEKLDGLYDRIDQMEENIKKEIENVVPTHLFDYTILTPFNSQIRGILDAIRTIKNDESLSVAEKLCEIGAQIKGDLNWTDSNSAFVRFDSLTTKFNNGNLLNRKDLFTLIYDHFVSTSMFSGEAIDKARKICDILMQEYLAGYAVLSECLLAQLAVNQLSPEAKKTLNPYYLNNISTNINQIKSKLSTMHKTVIGDYKIENRIVLINLHWDEDAPGLEEDENGEPIPGAWVNDGFREEKVEVFDTNTVSGKYDRMISQERRIFVNKGKSNKTLWNGFNILDLGDLKTNASDKDAAFAYYNEKMGAPTLSADEVKDLAKYAENKKMTIREFLKANGLDTDSIPKDAKLITSKAIQKEGIVDSLKSLVEGMFTGSAKFYTVTTGYNIDSRNAEEEEIIVWVEGTKYVVNYETESGTGAVINFN